MRASFRRIPPLALNLTMALTVAATLALTGCQGDVAPSGDTTTPDSADLSRTLLVVGGTVLTMDDAGTIVEDGAVAIEDGRIVAIGHTADLETSYPQADRIDARGRIVLPGLINAHTHVPMVLFRGLADDLVLMDWLEGHIFPAEAEFVDEEFVRWGTRLACLEMLRGGTTTFAEMYYFVDAIAEETERCGMRAVVGTTLIDFPAPDNKTWEEAVAYARRFVERWQGNPRITPAIAPHSAYTVSTEHLIESHQLAAEYDVPLLIHLVEDQGELERVMESTGRTSIDLLDHLGILDSRILAAHVVWPTDAEIDLLAERDVGVAHCPQSNMKVAAGVAPVPAMLEAGIAIGLGTDGAASNNDLNLWEEIDTAAKLHKVTTLDPTVVNAYEAIRMATSEGARALGLEDQIGSLEVGKRADLIVVGTGAFHQQPHYNPYSLLTYSTKASDVETVIVEGRVVVRDAEVLTLDAGEILAKTAAYRDRIRSQ